MSDNGLDAVAMLAGAVNGNISMMDQNAEDEFGQRVGRVAGTPDKINEADITGAGMTQNAPAVINNEIPSMDEIVKMGGVPPTAMGMPNNQPRPQFQQAPTQNTDVFHYNLESDIYQILIKQNLMLEKMFDLLYDHINGEENNSQ